MRFYAFKSAIFACGFLSIFYVFCCTVFVLDFLSWFHAFFNRYEVSVWDLCFLALMKHHVISLWGFMLLVRYAISLWFCFADNCLMRFHVCLPLWDFLLRFHAFRCIFCSNVRVMLASRYVFLRTTSLMWLELMLYLVVRGFGRGFRLFSRGCRGMHESEFWRRGVGSHAFLP